MELRPVDSSNLHMVAGWLAQKENYAWLDFGRGVQTLAPASLKIMAQRDIHLLRVFTPDSADVPIGLVALSDIAPPFKTAALWYLLGDKYYASQGYTTRAVSRLLGVAFAQLGLNAIYAWTVEPNLPSIRVLQANHFRLIGRQRQCHRIDGQVFDRLLFDLLASEYLELEWAA